MVGIQFNRLLSWRVDQAGQPNRTGFTEPTNGMYSLQSSVETFYQLNADAQISKQEKEIAALKACLAEHGISSDPID